MQGWRITMEDAHTTILDLLKTPKKKISFFAVFDGHGGSTVAKYAGEKLHRRLSLDAEFIKGTDYESILKEIFLGLDADLRVDPNHINDPSGCTAVSCVITDDWRVFCANAGDSRAVISANGEAIPLSFDHKPTNAEETKRIVGAGGFVEYGRVNGNLALSRAFGDFDFKKNNSLPPELQAVTAHPDVIERTIAGTDEFIVVACDGIWDCMSNQEVINFIRQEIINTSGDLGKICELLMDKCLAPSCDYAGLGCDNMTVIIVALLKEHKTKEDWVASVKNTVEKNGMMKNPNDPYEIEKVDPIKDDSEANY